MKGPDMHWVEHLAGLVLIAATRHFRREIGSEWFSWFGRYVCGCEWPDGLWRAMP